jgi:hypothetical protein
MSSVQVQVPAIAVSAIASTAVDDFHQSNARVLKTYVSVVVKTLSERYKFDFDEALEFIGGSSISGPKPKAAAAPKKKKAAPKAKVGGGGGRAISSEEKEEKKAHASSEESDAEEVGSDDEKKKEKKKSTKFFFPFISADDDKCQAIKRNEGLFTQCELAKTAGKDFCKRCDNVLAKKPVAARYDDRAISPISRRNAGGRRGRHA